MNIKLLGVIGDNPL